MEKSLMISNDIKTVLVTSGATVLFPRLMDIVVSTKTFMKLKEHGYKRIIIQYGRNYTSQYENKISKLCGIQKSNTSISELKDFDCNVFKWEDLEIIGIEFHPQLDILIKNYAELVISHAGTGSILDALRANKKLISCINDSLMENHQAQIAKKFKDAGYLWSIYPEQNELLKAIETSEFKELKHLPSPYNMQFAKLLNKLIFE